MCLIQTFSVDFINIIIALLIVWITFKFFRFWTQTTKYSNLDHTIFNSRIHDIKATYEPGSIPPPYPNTWYPVVQSGELKQGQVKPLYVLEKNLVVFRAMSGKVYVLDAFCPHFGAHLGVGGSVVGEDIRCPFHNWTFSGEGVCTSVPGLSTSNIPKAKVKRWKTIERNGWAYVWYHIYDHEPEWQPKEYDFHLNGTRCLEYRSQINCLLIDFLTNPFDKGHFEIVHDLIGAISGMQILQKQKYYNFIHSILHLNYKDEKFKIPNESDPDNNYDSIQEASVCTTITPVLFGYHLTWFGIVGEVEVCPPVIITSINVTRFGIKAYAIHNFIPEAPMKHKVTTNIYHMGDFGSRIMARLLLEEPDWIIFNNKLFLKNPCFTQIDKEHVKAYKWLKDNFYNNVQF